MTIYGVENCTFSVSSTSSVTYDLKLIECTYYGVWGHVPKGVNGECGALPLSFKLNSLYSLSSISVLSDYHCFPKINCNMS